MVAPVAIVLLEPFQEVQGWFLCDARSYQTLGHGILSLLDEEIGQLEEGKVVNSLRFSDCFVNAPKHEESLNQIGSAAGFTADTQVGIIVEALFFQVE